MRLRPGVALDDHTLNSISAQVDAGEFDGARDQLLNF
jgi:hypothetical protein